MAGEKPKNAGLAIALTFLAMIIALALIYSVGVASPAHYRFWLTLIILFGVVWILDHFVLMLRDIPPEASTTDASYSLGRAQMAFWTCLILGALIYVIGTKIISCTDSGCVDFEILKLDANLLILLGISGATGAVAMAIDIDKDKKATENRNLAAQADADIKKLNELLTAATTDPAQAGNVQELQSKLAAAQLSKRNAEAALERSLRTAENKGFFRDLLEDSNGNSLHRLQMILFTLVTGVIFVNQVIGCNTDCTMQSLPKIPDGVLELLGVSNTLYVGFKLPGK